MNDFSFFFFQIIFAHDEAWLMRYELLRSEGDEKKKMCVYDIGFKKLDKYTPADVHTQIHATLQ